jgi:hypothetical protein
MSAGDPAEPSRLEARLSPLLGVIVGMVGFDCSFQLAAFAKLTGETRAIEAVAWISSNRSIAAAIALGQSQVKFDRPLR